MNIRKLHVKQDFGHNIQCTRPIIDVEITNDVFSTSKLGRNRYDGIDICCIGIIVDDQIIQIYREPNLDDIVEFKAESISQVARHSTLHAFNSEFEYHGLRNYLGINSHAVEEIKPFKGKGWNKDRFFAELAEDKVINVRMPADPFHGDGKLAIDSWANGDIETILDHNVVCLLKEHYILENRDYLYNKYSHRINQQGWYEIF